MRPSLLVSLLLLSILFYEAQGIRLKKEFASMELHKVHEGSVIKTSNGGVGEVILCKDGQCSGNSRKLMTKTTSSTTTTSKNDKNGGNKQLSSSSVSEHREATSEPYPDSLDIAGMDYALARRKPPIHN
ncbi:uncharacterized protein LOC132277389 [Cornus florida]|uniref:uncharacterized protein LOC132277389 n=1 Tax=Cornus florida TaxID=4283 RepID=UPI00289813B5|nr:uncharacterized protein LOC132277389 [Cornus florida]